MLFNICHPPEDRTDADVSTVQWCKYMLFAATGSSIGSIERQTLFLLARYSSDQYCSYCAAKKWEKILSVYSVYQSMSDAATRKHPQRIIFYSTILFVMFEVQN